ncbi:MAG: hypothetical protein IPO29_08425 [Anaerolineae bacterium]|nr:hypothetical protein [Anaerolineae bacterium]
MNMHPWHHYVALGDSFTEGVGDPVEGFEMLGAMDRLAAALRQSNPALQVTNLAKRGLVLAEIRDQQLAPALGLKPDFVSVVGAPITSCPGASTRPGLRMSLTRCCRP